MSKPRLLDLFCGAGGAGMGYHRAGFEVVGVDIKPQPHYPFEFVQMDAVEVLRGSVLLPWRFDAIHASPPCQQFTRAGHLMRAQGKSSATEELVDLTRWSLTWAWGLPYVIENVPGAPMRDPVTLCGAMFGLGVDRPEGWRPLRRHRLFESSVALVQPADPHRTFGRPLGVYGSKADDIPSGGQTASSVAEAQALLGIDWTPRWDSLKEAIPPAYTEWIGRQLLAAINAERVA